MQAMKPKFKLW